MRKTEKKKSNFWDETNISNHLFKELQENGENGRIPCCLFGKDWEVSISKIQKVSEKDRNTTRVDGIDGITRLIKNKNRETVRAHHYKKLKI